jgi:glutamate-1-semialdehyde 2,1-aminomutase
MFQFYLRQQGLALSWVGSGRLIFSLNYDDAHFEAVSQRFIEAANRMHEDGWWHGDPSLSNKGIRRSLLREMLARRSRP